MTEHFRCHNDLFNYCRGTPTPDTKPTENIPGLQMGCVLDPKTCKRYIKASTAIKGKTDAKDATTQSDLAKMR